MAHDRNLGRGPFPCIGFQRSSENSTGATDMQRIVSCYSNNYGASGVISAVEGVADAGLAFIELALRGHNLGGLTIPESAVITEKSAEDAVLEFQELLRTRHVRVSSCNIGGGDLRTTEGFEITASRLRFARRTFDADVAVTGIGQQLDRTERVIVVDHLRRLGQIADELNMDLSLETHKGPTQNGDAMIKIIAEIDHPRVLLNFDTGNFAYYNNDTDVVEELMKVRQWVRSVHLKDNRGRFEDWYFPALGVGGAVDFIGVRKVLDEICFKGPYTIEIEGIAGEPELGLTGRHQRVLSSIRHLTSCGYFDEIS